MSSLAPLAKALTMNLIRKTVFVSPSLWILMGRRSEFAATRSPGVASDSASEVLSLLSGANSVTSTSNSLAPTSSLHTTNPRVRTRLSPVSETRTTKDRTHPTHKRTADKSIESNFEMVAPFTKLDHPTTTHTHPKSSSRHKGPSSMPVATAAAPHNPELTFSRSKIQPIRPLKSALTAMLASSESSSNPFAENYAAISGRGETASMTVQVYFPHATAPAGKPMNLDVRKDATVEEVIGFALWSYWEASWMPKLDDGLDGADDAKKGAKLSTTGWVMRIAEDDGEVDDEFPRTSTLCFSPSSALNTILPPTPQLPIGTARSPNLASMLTPSWKRLQLSVSLHRCSTTHRLTAILVQQNQILEGKIQRRPSRTTIAKKPDRPTPATTSTLTVPSTVSRAMSSSLGSMLGSAPLSMSLGPSSSHGPQIFLRIRVADTADAVHISTTIPVYACPRSPQPSASHRLFPQIRRDVHARSARAGLSEAPSAESERLCTPSRRQEPPHPPRSHRRQSAGQKRARPRQAVRAPRPRHRRHAGNSEDDRSKW